MKTNIERFENRQKQNTKIMLIKFAKMKNFESFIDFDE